MNKKWIWFLLTCVFAAAAILIVLMLPREEKGTIREENAARFGELLGELVNAYESPADGDEAAIRAALADIRRVSRQDHKIAASIAEHWRRVYLDPDYRLFLHSGEERAAELAEAGIPDGG